MRGNYDASGAFVGARPTGHLGIITTSSTLAANGTFYLIPLVDKNIGLRQTLPSHNLDDSTAVTPADLADFNALNSSRPVTSSITHNANVAYAFPRKRGSNFNDVSVRFGVNNVFDEDPPLADADVGYQRGAGTNPRGRVYSAQVSKRF